MATWRQENMPSYNNLQALGFPAVSEHNRQSELPCTGHISPGSLTIAVNQATSPKTPKKVTWPYLEEVDHLGVELGAFRQRVEDEVVDAPDAVAVEEVRAPRVQEQVAVPPEEPRSRPSHLSAEQNKYSEQQVSHDDLLGLQYIPGQTMICSKVDTNRSFTFCVLPRPIHQNAR